MLPERDCKIKKKTSVNNIKGIKIFLKFAPITMTIKKHNQHQETWQLSTLTECFRRPEITR